MTNDKLTLTAAMATLGLLLGAPAQASDIAWCKDGKTITFAGVDWESGAFIKDVVSRILADGYDCKTDSIPGNTITLEMATANGEVQIFAEDWIGRSEVLAKAMEAGKTIPVGHPFTGAGEGWFIPAYLVKGDAARGIAPLAPNLKSVAQLADPEIVKLFADPEEPSKGRFLNCPSGWTCEGVSTSKLEAYKLDASYVNFRPGTGTALDAEITSKIMQGQPILFYYWSPTAVMGKFDVVQLEEPAFNQDCWSQLTQEDGKRDAGCAFPPVEVIYAFNKDFHAAAPEVVDILAKAEFPLDMINASVAQMAENKQDSSEVAEEFLKKHPEIWGKWVSAEAADKIKASVN